MRPAKVERLVRQAAKERRAGRKEQAQSKLIEAVMLDPGNGKARHSLGVICYELGNLREAASHFDQACRLLRERPEPCYNLGLVLETGGKYPQALEAYEQALQRSSDHLPSLENLCRVRVRLGKRDSRTLQLVRDCLAREDRPEWVAWLNSQEEWLARAPATAPSVCAGSGQVAGGTERQRQQVHDAGQKVCTGTVNQEVKS